MSSALVRVSWVPVRRTPGHRSEMVNQALLGEVLELLESADASEHPEWVAARAADGYEGYVTRGSLRECSDAEAADWNAGADLTSLGTVLTPMAGEAASPRYAPWGARLTSDGPGAVQLPDGRRASPSDPSGLIADADRRDLYPSDPAAIARTATRWLGTPYVWGGRTELGTDCSGFVQAVFALHGRQLPRDSRDQYARGPHPGSNDAFTRGEPGELWFFAWNDRPVSHVGISLGRTKMIHASETRGGVAIDELGEGDFGRRLEAGFVAAVRPAG